MKHRKAAIAASVTLLAVALTGCGIQEGQETSRYYPETHYTFEQELPDGSAVLCVWAKSGEGGGLSCDWGGVR